MSVLYIKLSLEAYVSNFVLLTLIFIKTSEERSPSRKAKPITYIVKINFGARKSYHIMGTENIFGQYCAEAKN